MLILRNVEVPVSSNQSNRKHGNMTSAGGPVLHAALKPSNLRGILSTPGSSTYTASELPEHRLGFGRKKNILVRKNQNEVKGGLKADPNVPPLGQRSVLTGTLNHEARLPVQTHIPEQNPSGGQSRVTVLRPSCGSGSPSSKPSAGSFRSRFLVTFNLVGDVV